MFSAVAASRKDIAALRDESRAEAACQIVHDSRYDRRGWCEPYLLHVGGTQVGFAGLAMAGPWQGSRTAFDFYVLRTHRAEWPALWDAFAAASRADVAARADEALARCGLADRAESIAATLSHGEQRQLEIGMVLATQPRLLLLDEPMAGMSSKESQRMVELLRELKGSHTLVLIEHDMDVVFALADTITVLVNGAVLETGSPAAVQASPKVRAAYLGESAAA